MRARLAAAVLLSLSVITAIVAIVFATRDDDKDEVIVISTRVPETTAPATNTPQTPAPQQGLNFTEYYKTNCRGLIFHDAVGSPGTALNLTDEWQANVTACVITQQGHCNETGYVRNLALISVPPGSKVFEVNGDQLFGLPGRRLDNLEGDERNIFVHIPATQGAPAGVTSKLSMSMSCSEELTPVPATRAPAVPVPITEDSGTSSSKKAAVAFGVVSSVLLAAAIVVGVLSVLRPQPKFSHPADHEHAMTPP
eukprot:Rhum_TRINITY_DN12434_c0_g1::Rhum_TRINITY_DN12434_c0_g1_i1::g.51602::m.51602